MGHAAVLSHLPGEASWIREADVPEMDSAGGGPPGNANGVSANLEGQVARWRQAEDLEGPTCPVHARED